MTALILGWKRCSRSRYSRVSTSAEIWRASIQRDSWLTGANAMSSSLAGSLFAAALLRTNRSRAGPTVSPGSAGFQWVAGATVASSATLRGPVRRSHSEAIETCQLAAAWVRSASV